MRCPRHDGELIKRNATGAGGIPIDYHICLACLGHWIDAFSANYFPLESLTDTGITPDIGHTSLRCPLCQEKLERAYSDALAPGVLSWYCTAGHGYFFPRGQLRKFRTAQNARVTYHKLWNIPTPPLKSVLLGALILFMLVSGGIIVTNFTSRQVPVSQAKSIIASRKVMIVDGMVAFYISTSKRATLSITIDDQGIPEPMETTNGTLHTLILPDIGSGMHMYRIVGEIEDGQFESESYELYIPSIKK